MEDFDYLGEKDIYLDGACQSLRPRPVIEALNNYYEHHNSCGERVRYEWGRETDRKVDATREKVLKYLKLSPRKYFVSFTLNTTYGINLILQQLNLEKAGIKQIITTDIEHNSPFLGTISCAKKWNLPRVVISREDDGSVSLDNNFDHALVVMNAASNFNGNTPDNLDKLIKVVHKNGGLVLIDAAQAMAHSKEVLEKTDADFICFSAHKMYAPSLGGMIVKREMLPLIDTSFVGGGMVDDVDRETYLLSAENPDHAHTKFESGLQAWGEIIALGAAIDWLEGLSKKDKARLADYSQQVFEALQNNPKVHLTGSQAHTTMSFYVDGLDSHLLGAALADQGIMSRTGYFCVHYYLDHVKHYPPLVRVSLGYHNKQSDIDKFVEIINNL